MQRKLGKLLGGKSFTVGGTTSFSAEDVRKHMGLPDAFDVKSMSLSLESIKKKSLLNPRSAVFALSLTLVGKSPDDKPARNGVTATETVILNGSVLLGIKSGHVLTVDIKGTTSMTGTLKQPTQVLDLSSTGTILQKQLLVYSRS